MGIPFHNFKVTSKALNNNKYSQFFGHLHHCIKLFKASKHLPRAKMKLVVFLVLTITFSADAARRGVGELCYQMNGDSYPCKIGLKCKSDPSSNNYNGACFDVQESGCSCIEHEYKGYGYENGKCLKDFRGGSICYINNDATCSDKAFSAGAKKYYSWIACEN